MLLSLPADSIVSPSGVKPSTFFIPIEPWGSGNLRSENAFDSVAESQAISSPPVPAETSIFVRGENAIAIAPLECPSLATSGGISTGDSGFDISQRLIGARKLEATRVF